MDVSCESEPSRRICTLWIEGELRLVDVVCLSSMVDKGMDVTLFVYGDVPNVPAGVNVMDGESVLPLKMIEKLTPIHRKDRILCQPVPLFSDLFRVKCQDLKCGLWLDSDVFLFRQFEYDIHEVYFAKENSYRIGSPVFYLPAKHPMCLDYMEFINKSPDLMPDWLGFRRGKLKPFFYDLLGIEYSAADLGLTIYGNDAFTRLAKRHDCYRLARPKPSFYYWNGKKTEYLFESRDYRFFFDDPGHIGIHIHRKGRTTEPAVRNSFWEHALNLYGP